MISNDFSLEEMSDWAIAVVSMTWVLEEMARPESKSASTSTSTRDSRIETVRSILRLKLRRLTKYKVELKMYNVRLKDAYLFGQVHTG